MKHVAFLFWAILISASCASAQAASQSSWLFGSPFAGTMAVTSATSTPSDVPAASDPAASDLPATAAPSSPSASEPQQSGVRSVYQKFPFQLYGGYTFVRFNATSNYSADRNGLSFGAAYFYKDSFFGVEGDLTATFGSLAGYSSKFLIASGGPRFRWSGPRGIEYWGHGLVGGAHFTPRTSLGSQGAFAYRVGGGVDFNFSTHLSARAGVDLLGTHFFNKNQNSPLVTGGIVYKF